jgi:hypothetical protein
MQIALEIMQKYFICYIHRDKCTLFVLNKQELGMTKQDILTMYRPYLVC